jgi:hypothetical protein
MRRRWTLPWAALLAALLVLGAADLHPAGEAHSPLAPAGDTAYHPEASHPDQPLHLEQAFDPQRPHCPACLHRLQTSGAHLRAAASVAPLLPRAAVRAQDGPAARSASRRPSGARAPPSLS